jgi:hypothetical protein
MPANIARKIQSVKNRSKKESLPSTAGKALSDSCVIFVSPKEILRDCCNLSQPTFSFAGELRVAEVRLAGRSSEGAKFGEGGIRTPGPRKGSLVFKTSAFNHSATSPECHKPSPDSTKGDRSNRVRGADERCQAVLFANSSCVFSATFYQKNVAEREGFEPSVRLLTLHAISNRAPSATRSSLHHLPTHHWFLSGLATGGTFNHQGFCPGRTL